MAEVAEVADRPAWLSFYYSFELGGQFQALMARNPGSALAINPQNLTERGGSLICEVIVRDEVLRRIDLEVSPETRYGVQVIVIRTP